MREETTGIVIKSTGNHYNVMTSDQSVILCTLRGKFRTLDIKATNPVAVGDTVVFSYENNDTGIITEIKDRKNYIVRKSIKLSKRIHILAANVDHAYLLVTLIAPTTHLGFIDRFLVTAEAYGIPVTLLFNKIDLYESDALEILEDWKSIYEPLGYTCKKISALDKKSIEFLKNELKGKQSLLVGHSGVGKSTLINNLDPETEAKTGNISNYHLSGQHTTTFAELYSLKSGGSIIDTPGIKGFGLIGFEKEKLSHFFPEMRELIGVCKYHNCVHINEPGCVVKEHVESGKIAASRYNNYLSMYHDDDEENYRESVYR